ncbi:hypothetical protein [Pseudotabrizicola alkalilacus]|uniref:Uncharacterized protein n=1 Tax=Pseudotabrizicola alkalilacus TaxID=2305252 RepID=A0A411Z1K6_9RHOB|nr:hypothetical protein [Pseudotabrizicola alkalilacus]RGP36930.1 hypothetical protein D1012_12325 [Pseudotabrizicola alkalilacus]
MSEPYNFEPDPARRKRIALHRQKWSAANQIRDRFWSDEELEAESQRLEAEIQAFLARRDAEASSAN